MKKIFKNNKKGISGIEISVAILVITIGLSLVASLILNINKKSSKINREIEAIQIAKEIFEKIKVMPYEDYGDNTGFLAMIASGDYTALGLDIPTGYTLEIEAADDKTPTNTSEVILYNCRTEGNINVSYKLDGIDETVSLPFIKYFDRLIPKNEPDLNSTSVFPTDIIFLAGSSYEPGYVENGVFTLATNINEWKKYGIKDEYTVNKYARRKDTSSVYNYFKWEPRYITGVDTDKYLLGKTMYSLELANKTIDCVIESVPVSLVLNYTKIALQTETPLAGDQEGRWVKINL